jgi:hypothetical protein
MRRLMLSAAGLGLLAVFTGCNHMAGACDCDLTPTIACPCVHSPTFNGPPPPAPLVKPEPIKELPKPKPDKEPDKED